MIVLPDELSRDCEWITTRSSCIGSLVAGRLSYRLTVFFYFGYTSTRGWLDVGLLLGFGTLTVVALQYCTLCQNCNRNAFFRMKIDMATRRDMMKADDAEMEMVMVLHTKFGPRNA